MLHSSGARVISSSLPAMARAIRIGSLLVASRADTIRVAPSPVLFPRCSKYSTYDMSIQFCGVERSADRQSRVYATDRIALE